MNNPKAARRTRGRQQHKNGSQNGRRVADANNRVEQRSRGNPIQLLEKYKSLARDATTAGDRILAENYYQHADHYQRLVNERQGTQQHRQSHDHQRPQYERQQDETVGAGDDAAENEDNSESATLQADNALSHVNGGSASDDGAPAASDAVAATGDDGAEAAAKPRRRRRTPRPKTGDAAAPQDTVLQEADSSSGA